ncbi:MAG TPA: hypothetical protein PLB18_14900, partial [Acidobacteriota bacterium]|nr:hypothetical protein [Acidobacteriota bacterium]
LVRCVAQELTQLADQGLKFENLVVDQPVSAMESVAKQFNTTIQKTRGQSLIQPMVFQGFGKVGSDPKSDVARVVTAVETVRGNPETWSQDLVKAMRVQSLQKNIVEEESEPVLAQYLEQATTPGTQLNLFLNFLEDEALSRVRLAVAFKIMEAISEQASASLDRGSDPSDYRLLIEYIRRAVRFQHRVLAPDQEEILVRLVSGFGVPEFKLSSELCKASFYSCLPVWADAHSQMFEKRGDFDGQGQMINRELSYRFRINGIDPETQKTAFLSRLARIRERLAVQTDGAVSPRTLAELIFLWNVIPTDEAHPAHPDWTAPLLFLEQGGPTAAQELLKSLESRAEIVSRIGRTFVQVLKQSGGCVPESLQRRPVVFYLSLRKSLVNWVKAFTEGTLDPLIGQGTDAMVKAEWLRHVDVYDAPNPSGLLSIQVSARLSEHRLAVSGESFRIPAYREYPAGVVQILWHPTELKEVKSEHWAFPSRIEIRYEDKYLGSKNGNLNSGHEKNLAIYRLSFAILVETVLSTILRSVKSAIPDTFDISVMMFRIQTGGIEAEPHTGSQFVYAVGQSLEHALGRDWLIRGQGLVDSTSAKDTLPFRQRNAFGAMYSGFPLVIGRTGPGQVEKFGAVVFTSRPCDSHPEMSAEETGSVIIGKTYLAQTCEGQGKPAYRLTCGPNVLDIGFGQSVFEKPPAVMEAIRHLYDSGCRHIVFLSHRYGGRRVGRSAHRHRHHENLAFLQEVTVRFPDLHLFPLTRDIFPAIRLRQRNDNQVDEFEITGTDSHVPGSSLVREGQGMIPLYTLATLRYIGKDGNQKPQSGFSTYFYIKDDPGLEFFEWREKTSALIFGADPSVRNDLHALLRGIHFLESELPAVKDRVSPVLDPYQWMSPAVSAGVGDIVIQKKNGHSGQVIPSLPAVLARIHSILDLGLKGKGKN